MASLSVDSTPSELIMTALSVDSTPSELIMTALSTLTTLNPPDDSPTSMTPEQTLDDIVSDRLRITFQWIFYSVLCQLVDTFGIIANIINIMCFIKQGFHDPVTISLLGLAISDLCSLVPLIWTNICYNPAFSELDLDFEPIEVQYLTGAWPHSIFTRVTSWITAFITLERCLCIAIPLKVKVLVTPKRVTIIIIAIFLILIASVCPVYYVNGCAYKYSPARNKTIIGLVFTDNRDDVEKVLFAINNVFIPGTAFVIVIVCTVALVVNLRFKSQWRAKSIASKGSAQITTSRDQRVTKMVSVISAFFIICYLPFCWIVAILLVEPELSIDGKYRNTVIAVCGIIFLLESVNSASNIFIYYHMSSRYKATLRLILFGKETRGTT